MGGMQHEVFQKNDYDQAAGMAGASCCLQQWVIKPLQPTNALIVDKLGAAEVQLHALRHFWHIALIWIRACSSKLQGSPAA